MSGKKQQSIIPLTHTLRERSAILLYVCSMYIELCCSVALFGDTFIYLFFDTFMFLKYIQQIILFEWICLLSDLPIVIISICAGE